MTTRHYKAGDHLVMCDISGETIYASQARIQWDGRLVKKDYWEPKHPQLMIKSVKEKAGVPPPHRPDQAIVQQCDYYFEQEYIEQGEAYVGVVCSGYSY